MRLTTCELADGMRGKLPPYVLSAFIDDIRLTCFKHLVLTGIRLITSISRRTLPLFPDNSVLCKIDRHRDTVLVDNLE